VAKAAKGRRRGALCLCAFVTMGALITAPGANAAPELDLTNFIPEELSAALPDDTGLLVHIDFKPSSDHFLNGARLVSMTANVTPAGDIQLGHAVTAADLGIPEDVIIPECSDPGFEPTGYGWDPVAMPIAWQYRARSFRKRLGRNAVLRDLKKAHRAWDRDTTECSEESDSNFGYAYAGRTKRALKLDTVNIVERGRLPSGALATLYQWYRDSQIIESDLRLSKGTQWGTMTPPKPRRHFLTAGGSAFRHARPATARQSSLGRRAKRYRRFVVANVAAHEFGHDAGLEDLGAPHGELTMYASISRGEHEKVTLGAGDLFGTFLLNP